MGQPWEIDSLLDDPDRIRRMAANARRLGRLDAASHIVATALPEPPGPLWVSRNAQRAIRAAAEKGVSAGSSDSACRLVTLIDGATGLSSAIVTEDQLETLGQFSRWDILLDEELPVTPALLKNMNRPGADRDLRTLLRRTLGNAEQVTLRLGVQA
jgi:hypothetical protein